MLLLNHQFEFTLKSVPVCDLTCACSQDAELFPEAPELHPKVAALEDEKWESEVDQVSNFAHFGENISDMLAGDLDATCGIADFDTSLDFSLLLRSVMDPKRHYKKGDTKSKALPKYFQVGTVIESASDFYSGRLTKKERKQTLAEELLSDHHLGDYRKRKVREIEEHNRPAGNEKWKNKGPQTYKSAKQRRH
ncbi:hypothetical protein GIB67_003354 [Kingdonia uniflora]|uniref:Fcf2 pre-rRNA processing C-terminal domain-containing protein n=1 Tax=Kingdonia uniflora TaxID=39325 RepID=A0A7J7P8W9_9MAGN|nr:hypothetical protein GIB67_003354 [Kingdonia uniflora]